MNDAKLIHVVTGCLFNQNAELLVVRKRNTERFMLPGGKPEAGESPAATLLREWQEELGIQPKGKPALLGTFTAAAANEPDHRVSATTWLIDNANIEGIRCAAEIAEYAWISLDPQPQLPLAPLLQHHIIPALQRFLSGPGAAPVD